MLFKYDAAVRRSVSVKNEPFLLINKETVTASLRDDFSDSEAIKVIATRNKTKKKKNTGKMIKSASGRVLVLSTKVSTAKQMIRKNVTCSKITKIVEQIVGFVRSETQLLVKVPKVVQLLGQQIFGFGSLQIVEDLLRGG